MRRREFCGMVLGALGAGLAGPRAADAAAREWAPKQFPISFWCGPPEPFVTPEQYRQVAAAGFDYLMPPCDGPVNTEVNRKILDTARAAGLKVFLSDPRLPAAIGDKPEARKAIDDVVADYASHPALAGYFLTDEPATKAFKGLGDVVAYLRQKDPVHAAFINLLPNYATRDQLGSASYDQYVAEFIQTVKPFVVSYDHYALLQTSERPEFFPNLETVRKRSIEAGLPFWQIVLDTQHGGYRAPNEAEKRWQAMQTLVYGGQGLMWFTYWTPNDPTFQWGPGIVDRQGKPTAQYAEIQRINRDVRALGNPLMRCQPLTIFRNQRTGLPRQPGNAVSFPGTGDVRVGLFRDNGQAEIVTYALFANGGYKQAVSTDVDFNVGRHKPQHLNKATGNWTAVRGDLTFDQDLRVRLQIAPGDAELYRWY